MDNDVGEKELAKEKDEGGTESADTKCRELVGSSGFFQREINHEIRLKVEPRNGGHKSMT